MGLLLENTLIELLCTLLMVMFWAFYSNVTQHYSYWVDKGVPHIQPTFLFGSLKDFILGRMNLGQLYQNYYNKFKGERYFGIYDSRKPILILRDPELIKHILIKDFNHFSDRFILPIDKKNDYISIHLFNMSSQQGWKKMRSKLTPTFTSGKMKMMYVLMLKCSEQLRDHVDKQISNDPVIDVKDVLSRFTMDIIATCAFGLEINSQTDKDCEFYHIGMKMFQTTTLGIIRRVLFSTLPFMNKIITQRFTHVDISNFLSKIVRDTVDYREKNNVNRNDFLDLLIKIRQNKSLLEDDDQSNGRPDFEQTKFLDKTGLSVEEITAQSFIFFVAGFETASSTMTFCLYELACNPDVQEKLSQEIKKVLAKHGGTPTYQSLQEMTYMDQVINETLRRYASLGTLQRTCTETYKVPDSDLVLEKGQKVTIPIYAIHHDPEYYPEPYKFDPERFTVERVRERHTYLHMPFGEGPRMCIGMRFGLLQTKIGLTQMVSAFKFELTPETPITVTINPRSFITQPEKPIMLKLTKRKA